MTPQPQIEQWRHHDYVFSVPPLVSGQLIQAFPFQFDADYPFEMRSMAARVPYSSTAGPTFGTQAGLNLISMRWSGPNNDYRQAAGTNATNTSLVPLNLLLGPYFGQLGNPKPVYPPIRYPRSGFMMFDIRNDGPNTITGLQIFMRGVKVGPWGSWDTYTYPAQMGRQPLPFWYPSQLVSTAVPNPALQTQTLAVNQVPILNNPFVPDIDSDFVFRFGQAGLEGAYEVFITLRDEGWRPYSTDGTGHPAPVHADILFGRSGFPAVFPCGPANFVAPVGPGASQPGLIVPEIYLPKNHRMYYDIQRDDRAYAGAAPVDYPMTWGGMKVYPA
jgi:hypothetical protein